MSKQILVGKLDVKYQKKNGETYPFIVLERKDGEVGKYGLLWIRYIMKKYPQRYETLLQFGELHSKAAVVNEVAYELLEDIENEWLVEHRQKESCSFKELYQLHTMARTVAEEVVLQDVVNCFH